MITELKKFLLPFTNRRAWGETEGNLSKMGLTLAVAIIVILFSTSLFLIFKGGQTSIANSNAKQIQNENTSVTRSH